jgi:hypothetical protein
MLFSLLLISLVSFCSVMQSELPESLVKKPFVWTIGDGVFQMGTRYRVEGLYGKNTEFLNNANEDLDQTIIPARHTFDINAFYTYGLDVYGYSLVTFKTTIRNKANWGALDIVPTDKVGVHIEGALTGEHYHTLNRNLLWIREISIEAAIGEMFNLNFANNHTITAGFFPFELGRGISLGAAYATDPDMIGFYSPNAVDQFAPGVKLSGTLDSGEALTYDLYTAILANRSDVLANVRKPTLKQEYGRQCRPARGFGYINWLFAGRLQWHVYRQGDNDIVIEPYVLFVDQREQKVQFLDDANTKLGTVGVAFDTVYNNFQWGFEFAQNLGHQQVKGWDRNVLKIKNREGDLVEVNSEVLAINSIAPDVAGERALATAANQLLIEESIRSQTQNGQRIGMSNLRNSKSRFRDPYVNHFDGYMAILDAMYTFCPGLKLAATAGIATGDINPNRDHNRRGDSQNDTTYGGFISVQEQYSGRLVNSAFVMSGAGKIPRILSFPARDVDDPFPDRISQLSNLIFAGAGAYLEVGSWVLNSNMISYWQEHATRIFKQPTDFNVTRLASTWLGLEFNLFADVCFDNTMKFYGVASVFVPGSHYSDIQGIPLTIDQKKYLDALKNNTPAEQVPLLGTNAAFALNVGFEYRF